MSYFSTNCFVDSVLYFTFASKFTTVYSTQQPYYQMNKFGGVWTQEKIEIFMKYVPAYLTIMNAQMRDKLYAKNWKLIYFDGFAGSGTIQTEDSDENLFAALESNTNLIQGVASKLLSIEVPRYFDKYVFIDLKQKNAIALEKMVKTNFPNKNTMIQNKDFNIAILELVDFLKQNKQYKCLMLIDPYGMSVHWASIEKLKGLSVDVWMLLPTGVGINRLLKNDSEINELWMEKLEIFLGLDKAVIKSHFYKSVSMPTLFGEPITIDVKQENAIKKAHLLYKERLQEVFSNVSDAYVMRNSKNSILYHFLLASNNATAIKIANYIVGKGISKI